LKITKTITSLFVCILLSACSTPAEHSERINTKINEDNHIVKDLEVTYLVSSDKCIKFSQSIVEIKNLNSNKPIPKYLLSHERINCP
jgi:starvation-inducible outer membrane lipoprotein